MADKNNNGVDDALEKNKKEAKYDASRLPGTTDGSSQYKASTDYTKGRQGIGVLGGHLQNAFTDISRRSDNLSDSIVRWASGRGQAAQGAGFGDSMWGAERPKAAPVRSTGVPKSIAAPSMPSFLDMIQKGNSSASAEPQGTQAMSFAEALQEALGLIPGSSISYEPQRQTLRSNASESDARLAAMYRQLSNSIAGDAAGIASNHDAAIAQSKQISDGTAASIQAAADSANAKNTENLAALGIGDAAQQTIAEGRDLNTQTAGALQNAAPLAGEYQQRLLSNKGSALDMNSTLVGAAGLEGNLQRAQNQAKLMSLLASIDMAEQEANASAEQNRQSTAQSLASTLVNLNRSDMASEAQTRQAAIDAARQDAQWQAELSAKQGASPSAAGYQQFLQQLQDLGVLSLSSDDPELALKQNTQAWKMYAG